MDMSVLIVLSLILALYVLVASVIFFAAKNKDEIAGLFYVPLKIILKVFGAVYNGFVWFFF
ncbi:MAG: hypothetical protein J5798_01905 [Spirochaetaceae bacterium]|nr:hypothetical protein [Spirochaetaceae bacterium]MBR4824292.1 hypothetical protein [Spirochaetaceae bacterium]